MNDKLSPRERGLIKGSLRRVFSRSDLRRKVLDIRDVPHSDPTRPRVKKWSQCEVCAQIKPKYTMAVDHKVPLIPLDRSLEEMTWDEVIDRLWCEASNLQVICEECHLTKSSTEAKIRREHKALKRGTNAKPKRTKKKSAKCRVILTPRNVNKRTRISLIQTTRRSRIRVRKAS